MSSGVLGAAVGTAALALIATALPGCAALGPFARTIDGCPSFRAALIWTSQTSRPSWLEYYDPAGTQVGRTSIDVQGIGTDDQTPGHSRGKVVLSASGNTVHDQTNLLTFDPVTCTMTSLRDDEITPLSVTPFDDGYLAFGWTNGWAELHHLNADGQQVAAFRLNDWVGLTGLTVTDDAVYVIANYGEEKKAYLLVLDRDDLHEVKRVLLPQIVSDGGPEYSALIGDKLYFPADRQGDFSATDTALGVVDVRTFATGTVELEVASPYIVRAVGTSVYVAHTTMQAEGHEVSVLDTATGAVTHRDLGFSISSMDVNETTLAVAGYTDLSCTGEARFSPDPPMGWGLWAWREARMPL